VQTYIVIGFASDANELLLDFVAADSPEAAEDWFKKYRPYCDHCESFDRKWLEGIVAAMRRTNEIIIHDMQEFERDAKETCAIAD